MSKQSKNCQVPTPDKYVKEMLDYIGYTDNLFGKKVLENSCGEGNILVQIVSRYIFDAKTQGILKEEIVTGLEQDIVAYEVDQGKIDICIERLNKILESENIPEVKWNIKMQDFLKSKEQDVEFIIGNPPYITYHDLLQEERDFIKEKYSVCRHGRVDYCYAFIEASINSLAQTGKMVYLIPFSIFRNKFAGELRVFLKSYVTKIYDYREIKVFPGITCSTALIVCEKQPHTNEVQYKDEIQNREIFFSRVNLDATGKKWIFQMNTFGSKRFGDYFEIHNGVATLHNEAFLFCVTEKDSQYYYVHNEPIERSITLPAVSTKSSKKSTEEYRIIFPYKQEGKKISHFSAEEMQNLYPNAWKYLLQFEGKLKERKADKNAKWYEYGRTQALESIWKEKIILPMVITKATQVFIAENNAIPYAGYFITVNENADVKLTDAVRMLQSEEFYQYAKDVGTPTSISTYRISVHDICEFKF